MWVLYLGLLASLMIILKIFLSSWLTLAPRITPGVTPGVACEVIYFKLSNPFMWVLYLVLLESLLTILKIFLNFGQTLAPGSPQGVTQGVVQDVIV